ncbi:TPA: peptidase C1 [Bacillus cereus]|nr:peptidase C1 [Bacillus cereus]
MNNQHEKELEHINNELSKNNNPWQAEINNLFTLTLDEKKKYLGAILPPTGPVIENISLTENSTEAINIPQSYDLRNVNGNNFVTSVKFQKECGSCVAFGLIATVESTLRLQRNDPNLAVDFSEAHLFFCHGKDSGINCSSGWWVKDALIPFNEKGVVDEDCYKYDDGLAKKDCSGLCSDSNNRLMKIQGYENLTNNPTKIKEWISSNKGPVCSTFVVYNDFFSYKNGVYKHLSGSLAGGHCVAIIGYDDDQGCWICKNSWDSLWGDQGFFRIAYGECDIEKRENYGVYL